MKPKMKHYGMRVAEGTALRLIQLGLMSGVKPSTIARLGINWVLAQPVAKIVKLAKKGKK